MPPNITETEEPTLHSYNLIKSLLRNSVSFGIAPKNKNLFAANRKASDYPTSKSIGSDAALRRSSLPKKQQVLVKAYQKFYNTSQRDGYLDEETRELLSYQGACGNMDVIPKKQVSNKYIRARRLSVFF